jgi:hypothetical protein
VIVRMAGPLGAGALLTVAMMLTGVSADAQRAKAPAPAKAPAKGKAAPVAAPKIDVSVVGLKIVGAAVGPSEYGDVTAFSSSTGVEVALAVRVPAGHVLIDANEDDSAVESMVDDQGTNLAEEASFGFSPDFTKDKDALITTVRVGGVPSASARELTLSGHLAVQTARGEQVSRATKVTLAKGQTFKAGSAAYTVEEVETDGDDTMITLAMTRRELEVIKDIRVLDAAGTALETRQTMRGYSMDDAQMTYAVTGASKVVTVEVVRHENLMTQKVPFSFTIGLGTVR